MKQQQTVANGHLPDRSVANVQVGGKTLKQAKAGEQQLGDVYFFSIPYTLELEASKLLKAGEKAGIPAGWLPKPTKPPNAFKRAVEELQSAESHEDTRAVQSEQVKTKGPDGKEVTLTRKTTMLVRPSPNSTIHRNIVKEVVLGQEKPVYTVLGVVRFKQEEGVQAAPDPEITDDDLEKFAAMASKVNDRYAHWLQVYNDKDVRGILVRAEGDMQAIKIRPSGGIYFCPIEHRAQLKSLETFLTGGLSCEAWVIPVSSVDVDPKALGEKLTDAVEYEVSLLLEEIEKLKKLGLGPDRYATLIEKLQSTRNLHGHYQKLLRLDLETASLKLDVAEKEVMGLKRRVRKKGVAA